MAVFNKIQPYPFPFTICNESKSVKKSPPPANGAVPFEGYFRFFMCPFHAKIFNITLQLQSISICCRCYRMLLLEMSTANGKFYTTQFVCVCVFATDPIKDRRMKILRTEWRAFNESTETEYTKQCRLNVFFCNRMWHNFFFARCSSLILLFFLSFYVYGIFPFGLF